MNIQFETQRLLLKPVTLNDTEILHSIFVDSYVRKYLFDDTILSMQEVEKMLLENQKLFDQENLGLWFIQTKPDLKIIGIVGLWYFFDEDQPQLIYALLPAATQKGYAAEAASELIDYCFNTLDYGYLTASTNKPNLASQSVATRLGMKFVKEQMIEGQPLLFFRLEKSDLT